MSIGQGDRELGNCASSDNLGSFWIVGLGLRDETWQFRPDGTFLTVRGEQHSLRTPGWLAEYVGYAVRNFTAEIDGNAGVVARAFQEEGELFDGAG